MAWAMYAICQIERLSASFLLEYAQRDTWYYFQSWDIGDFKKKKEKDYTTVYRWTVYHLSPMPRPHVPASPEYVACC